jgi:ribosomal protein S19
VRHTHKHARLNADAVVCRRAAAPWRGAGEKPEAVRTHLRNMIVVPEMIGSVVGVYNGKTFNQVR